MSGILSGLVFLVGLASAEEAHKLEASSAGAAELEERVLQALVGPLDDPPADGTPVQATLGDAPLDLDQVWAGLSVQAVLSEAVARRRVGDFEGSLRRFEHLRGREAGTHALVQEGITLEYVERYDDALANYDLALASADGEQVAVEAAFRRALVLEDLGRHDESVAQVRALQQRGGWEPLQELALELTRGVDELAGSKARKGLKRIDKALALLEGEGELPWLEAKARTAVAEYLLVEAEDLALEGNKKAGRNLVARTRLMVAAEQQVIAVAQLGEPEYILEGLVLLGDAYLNLHDDMLAAPAPRKLDAEQELLYAESVAEKAAVLPAKALRYYDEGVQVAVRTAWQGQIVDDLRARRDAAAAEL